MSVTHTQWRLSFARSSHCGQANHVNDAAWFHYGDECVCVISQIWQGKERLKAGDMQCDTCLHLGFMNTVQDYARRRLPGTIEVVTNIMLEGGTISYSTFRWNTSTP